MAQPRSILQLVLLGFLVVLLPVVGALIYGARTMNAMSVEHRDHLGQVSRNAETLQKMASDLTDAERLARQYLLLKDATLLELFHSRAQALQQSFRSFEDDAPVMRQTAESMQASVDAIVSRMDGSATLAQDDPAILGGMDKLNDNLETLRSQAELTLRSHVETAKIKAQQMRATLMLVGGLLVPGTLLLVGLFSVLITRPIQEIERSIRDIGSRVYRTQKTPRGPKDLQLVAKRLEWLRERLHSSEESQERFLHHVSHELKTPLASIKEGVELLSDEVPGPLNPSQRSVIDILTGGVQHFQVLINNLLDFNLMRGERVLKREEVELRALVEGVVRPHLLTAQRKDLAFEVQGPRKILLLDRAVIAAALDNLVSNAVQFSPVKGRVTIRWEAKGDGVSLLVGDEGPGIAPDEQSKVFLPFFQGKAQRSGPLKGTGLGLSVARECVESHQGKLRILEAAQGAWFEIFLPQDARLVPN